MNPYTDGNAVLLLHAGACLDRRFGGCRMPCRCWCHGITRHLNRSLRRDTYELPGLVSYIRVLCDLGEPKEKP